MRLYSIKLAINAGIIEKERVLYSTRGGHMDLIEKLAAIEEIKQVRYRYCFFLDERDWEAMSNLFTEDAVGDYGRIGTVYGKEGIRKLFEETVSKLILFSAHYMQNPVIDVYGDTATGQWYISAPGTVEGDKAVYALVKAYDTYRKVEGVWKIQSLKYDWKFFTSYEKGWAKEPFFS
jgi:ketosteroid isomerase-like protein